MADNAHSAVPTRKDARTAACNTAGASRVRSCTSPRLSTAVWMVMPTMKDEVARRSTHCSQISSRRYLTDQPTIVQPDNPRTELLQEGPIVAHHEVRAVRPVGHQVVEQPDSVGVQPRGGFVQQPARQVGR